MYRNKIHKWWEFFKKIPFGKSIFGKFINFAIPYTGTINASIDRLEPGFAVLFMRDRRIIRNHLKSIHAIALANLAEYTGNLAVAVALPPNGRFIVKKLTMNYHKKARGTLSASCQTINEINLTEDKNDELEITVDVRDEIGAMVAQGFMTTVVGIKNGGRKK